MSEQQQPQMAVLITRDGRRIDLDANAETYLQQALDCRNTWGSSGRPYDGLIDNLIGRRQHGHADKEAVLKALEDFEAQWETFAETINEAAKRYPELVREALHRSTSQGAA